MPMYCKSALCQPVTHRGINKALAFTSACLLNSRSVAESLITFTWPDSSGRCLHNGYICNRLDRPLDAESSFRGPCFGQE